jgi:hypothetical protein
VGSGNGFPERVWRYTTTVDDRTINIIDAGMMKEIDTR